MTDGRNAGGGRNASTSGKQTTKSRDRLHTTNTLQTIERGCFIDFRENVFHPRTTEKKVEKSDIFSLFCIVNSNLFRIFVVQTTNKVTNY